MANGFDQSTQTTDHLASMPPVVFECMDLVAAIYHFQGVGAGGTQYLKALLKRTHTMYNNTGEIGPKGA